MSKIAVKCRKVYETGSRYLMYKDKIGYDQKKLLAIGENIMEAWGGEDRDRFIDAFNTHVSSLGELLYFLENESTILKEAALNHSNNDNNFALKMKRSDNI